MIKDLEKFEKKLYDALIVWKATNEFTDNLSDLFMELIEHVFVKRIPVFPSSEIREVCNMQAYLACYEGAKKFDPDKIIPKIGKKTNPRIYFTIIIRCSLAAGYVKAMKKLKFENNESQSITL